MFTIQDYQALVKERDALRAKLDASERAAAAMLRALLQVRLAPLSQTAREMIDAAITRDAGRDYVPRAELERVQFQNAAMYEALNRIGRRQPDEATHPKICDCPACIARDVLKEPTCGLYVPRAEVDAAWRKGMTDGAKIASLCAEVFGCECSQRILSARDARKESGEPTAAPGQTA